MCVGKDLVSHAPKQTGGGLRGENEGLHHSGGQLADHAPDGARQPLLLVPPGGHITDGLSRVQDALRKSEVSHCGVGGEDVGVGLGEGQGRITSRTVS